MTQNYHLFYLGILNDLLSQETTTKAFLSPIYQPLCHVLQLRYTYQNIPTPSPDSHCPFATLTFLIRFLLLIHCRVYYTIHISITYTIRFFNLPAAVLISGFIPG